MLAAFLCLVFLTGGASRVDVLSLAILRPVSILACAVALVTLRKEHWQGRGWLLILASAIFGLALLHVIPLPPSLWQTLPGRAQIADIDRLAGLGDIWRPLTLTPMNGLHALSSLFAPLAVLLLGLQLTRPELYRLLPLVIVLGALSGFLGLLQIIGGENGPLYLYRITNNGSAVGLFSNRNHAALLLAMLFPMLAIFASTADGTADKQQGRRILALAIAGVLLPLIFVTGSRAGLLFVAIALASVPLLYRRPAEGRKVRRGDGPWRSRVLPIVGGFGIFAFTLLTIVFSRAQSLDRLLNASAADDARLDFWMVSTEIVRNFFPVGSGSGSFAEAFRIYEPDRMLSPNYVNHAHNDWLEVSMTFGLPGILLIVLCIMALVHRATFLWGSGGASGRAKQFGRLATILLGMLAIASIPDYPLRTPTMMCLASLFALWLLATEAATVRLDSPFTAVEN